MPLLAAFFGSAFAGLLSWFMQFFTRKVALYLTVITTLTGLTAALLVVFLGLLAGLVQTLPADWGWVISFIPENAPQCLAAYASAALAKWVYDWNTTLVQKALS